MDETRRLAELEQENKRLRAELEHKDDEIKRHSRLRSRVAGFAISSAVRVLLSASLVDSLKAWLRARSLSDPMPVDETAEVLAAVLRRVIRVGFVGLAVAALPMILLIWQNILIQRQVSQQASDTLIVRRAQLLDTIYGCEEEEDLIVDGEPACRPRAPMRAREEAVLAFVKIERDREIYADLTRANLSGANLRRANLSRVSFVEANLARSQLTGADFKDSSLIGANLFQATLIGADLKGANLFKADLSFSRLGSVGSIGNRGYRPGANLARANLARANLARAYLAEVNFADAYLLGAILLNANLTRADLSTARNLTQVQINEAFGNGETKLPPDLTHPAHWTTDPRTPLNNPNEPAGKPAEDPSLAGIDPDPTSF